MKLTKIHVNSEEFRYKQAPMYRSIDRISDVLVLVPDEESLHAVQGTALILNVNIEVHLLEPGMPMSWQGMFSPWHLNTDRYRLTFNNYTPIYVERL